MDTIWSLHQSDELEEEENERKARNAKTEGMKRAE